MAIAIVTCMDNRLQTVDAMGLDGEQAHVMRNAGGRVTGDVLRSLTAATCLLGVRRVAVVHHTDCRALAVVDDQMRQRLTAELGHDPGPLRFLGDPDLAGSVRQDMAAVRGCTTLPRPLVVEGYIYDTDEHRLTPVDDGPGTGRADPAGFRSHDGLPW